MKKIETKKSGSLLHENMDRKNLSLDRRKADPFKKNIDKQLGIIQKTLGELEVTLNRMSMKRLFTDDHHSLSMQCAKKCASQAQSAKSLMANLDLKYMDDEKMILISELDDRITEVEKRIAEL
jgi:hypothetical protein